MNKIENCIDAYDTQARMAVISKKNNTVMFSDKTLPSRVILAIKEVSLDKLSCDKLKQYSNEGRLVVIESNTNAQVKVHHRNKAAKSVSMVQVRIIGKEQVFEVVLQYLKKKEYASLLKVCLEALEAPKLAEPENPKKDDGIKLQYRLTQECHNRFDKQIKYTVKQFFLRTLHAIIESHFETIRKEQEEINAQNKEAQKRYEKMRDELMYRVRQCVIAKMEEEKAALFQQVSR